MKWRVCFLLDGKNDGYIRMRVTINKKRVNFGVGLCRISSKNWSRETQRVRPNSVNGTGRVKGSVINAELQRLETAANAILESCHLSGEDINTHRFREEFLRATGRGSDAAPSKSLVSGLFIKFISDGVLSKSWTHNTRRNHVVVSHQWRDFNSAMCVEDISSEVMQQFTRYLIGRGLRNETILKYLINTRVFLSWCRDENFVVREEVFAYRPRLKTMRKPIIYLTAEELALVESRDLAKFPHLDRVRDVFVFCCYSGLRYSDVRALAKKDISNDAINIYTQKTGTLLGINLNNKTRYLLNKYANGDGGNALPVISNQKMNKDLHELLRICGVDATVNVEYYVGNTRHAITYKKYQLVTTHCARRTFISRAIAAGVPPHVVMKWSGHSDYKTMIPYIDIDGAEKRRYMSIFDAFSRERS